MKYLLSGKAPLPELHNPAKKPPGMKGDLNVWYMGKIHLFL